MLSFSMLVKPGNSSILNPGFIGGSKPSKSLLKRNANLVVGLPLPLIRSGAPAMPAKDKAGEGQRV